MTVFVWSTKSPSVTLLKKKVFCHGTLGSPLPNPALSLATSMRLYFLDGWVPRIIASNFGGLIS